MMIDYSRLRSITARKIIRALERDGFILYRQRGSHCRYRHPDGRRATVSYHHSGSPIPLKTLQRIIESQAKWTEIDLYRLGLL